MQWEWFEVLWGPYSWSLWENEVYFSRGLFFSSTPDTFFTLFLQTIKESFIIITAIKKLMTKRRNIVVVSAWHTIIQDIQIRSWENGLTLKWIDQHKDEKIIWPDSGESRGVYSQVSHAPVTSTLAPYIASFTQTRVSALSLRIPIRKRYLNIFFSTPDAEYNFFLYLI